MIAESNSGAAAGWVSGALVASSEPIVLRRDIKPNLTCSI